MKPKSLSVILIAIFTVVSLVAFEIFLAVDYRLTQEQEQRALVREARMFSREMDAVWDFVYHSQDLINYTRDGIYEFKGLHCAVVGKSVGVLFSRGTDYSIRYTGSQVRNPVDAPDEFEVAALAAFADEEVREYYQVAPPGQEGVFRYVRQLTVDETCLECHGDPVGEIDMTGYPKEGWDIGDVGGALSITIPLDIYQEAVWSRLFSDAVFFVALLLLVGGSAFFTVYKLVQLPMRNIQATLGDMREHDFSRTLPRGLAVRELDELTEDVNSTSSELETLYNDMGDLVRERTEELETANEGLVLQRRQLQELNEKLEEEIQYKSDFLSMVSHDLRTPLTSIITQAQVSLDAAHASGNVDDANQWGMVQRNSQELLAMVNNVLDMARIDAGRHVVRSELVDLADVLAKAQEIGQSLALNHGVAFSAQIDYELPLVIGDEEYILRILENLIGNAVKFTPESRRVRLIARYDEQSQSVILEVADEGVGIAPEDQSRIFERFTQVGQATTGHYGGSGLGLALVRVYVGEMGYNLSLTSELGQGSTFTVRIPQDRLAADELEGEDDA